jgi:hypothetical protein
MTSPVSAAASVNRDSVAAARHLARWLGLAATPTFAIMALLTAALGGGAADLRTVYPSKPFAPDTSIGAATRLVGFPVVDTSTRWIEADGAYTGHCSSANGADVLEIAANDGAPTLRPVPNAAWGLHLTDANISLGNLVTTVRHEISTYRARLLQSSGRR